VKTSTPLTDSSGLNYNPFGMLLVGRSWEAGSGYRFGFNRQEQTHEVYGEDNLYSTYYRDYDPRISRWISIDPEFKKYSNISPYCSFIGNPLYYVDIKGDDIIIYCSSNSTTPILTIVTDKYKGEYTLPDWINCSSIDGLDKTYELKPFTSDAFLVTLDASFSFGGGALGGFSVAFINSGIDDGGVFLYGQAGPTIGMEGGVAVVGGSIDFNENNSKKLELGRDTFEGKSQGASGSFGWFTITTIKSYVDGEWHSNFDKRSDILYEGTLVGGGVGGGGNFYFSKGDLLAPIIEPDKE